MTTKIPSSLPDILSQRPGEKQTSPVMKQGAQFQQKLCALLDAEDTARIQAKNKRTQELLELIKAEVEKRSEEIGYDYESEDYAQRLCMSDEEFEEVLREKILIGELGAYYIELTSLYGENPIMLQKLLREYCIEDFVYESVEEYEEKIYRIKRDELTERLENHRWDDLQSVKSINLFNTNLGEFDRNSLKEIFSILQGVKSIDLGRINLGVLDKDTLKAIFSNLQGVKSIYLTRNNLGELDKDSFKAIFSNLQCVKNIYLSDNNLGELDKDSFKAIFSNLQCVKSINLRYNRLGTVDKDTVEEIFRHLNGVRNLDLSHNDLGTLDKDSVKEIFRHLKGVKDIYLWGNNLGSLDRETLKEIFSNLGGVKSIKLGNNNLLSLEQKDLIIQLLPSAKIEF